MIGELWKRLLGKENWVETEATVYSAEKFQVSADQYGSFEGVEVTFWYRDQNGEMQSGSFKVDPDSPLHSAEKDEKITISYDQNHPERYRSSEAGVPSWRQYWLAMPILFLLGFGLLFLLKRC